MIKRKTRTTTKKSQTPPIRDLILIPNAPIRKEVRERYQNLLDKIQTLQSGLHQFLEEDQPAYERWLQAEFGPLLSELQKAKNEAAAKQNLIIEVDLVALRFGLSHFQAYQRIQIQREKLGGAPKKAPEAEEDPLHDTFERMFGFRPGNMKKGDSSRQEVCGETLKSLYRQLVRRLHPDIRKIHSPQMDSLWFDAQQAYLGRNLAEMKQIVLLCDAEECVADSEPTVSMLLRVSEYLEQKRAQLDRELNHYKSQPAWGFSKSRDDRRRKSSISKLRRSYELELLQAREELSLHEATLRDYSHPPSFRHSMVKSANRRETIPARPVSKATPVKRAVPTRSRRSAREAMAA